MATATKQPPYTTYATIMGAFAGGLGVAGALARILDRNPACQSPLDLVVLSAASFKDARTLARDEVTSFLRDPFVRGRAHTGEDEEPVETGDWEQAIGAGFATTQIIAPRFGRLLTWSFAAAGLNDFLHTGFSALRHKANELEVRSDY